MTEIIKKYDFLKEELYSWESEKGLKVHFLPKKNFNKQYAMFATNFGSIDNKFIPIGEEEFLQPPDGIAHFLEHKLFQEEDMDIFDKFSELGVNANAYTNFNQTSYLFSSTENFYEALEILIKFVQNPYFIEKNIEKEKGIIEQEIKMYDDDPGWTVFFNALNALYSDHPVRIDIAGTVESIQEVDKDLLYRTYNTFYHPENMVLFISGDLSFDRIKDLVDRVERKDYTKLDKIERYTVKEDPQVNKKLVVEEMSTSKPIFYIGFKDQDLNNRGKAGLRKDLVTNIMLDMLFSSSSIFYNKLYDQGLIDSNFGAYYSLGEGYGHSFIVGEADDPGLVYEKLKSFIKGPVEEILLEEDFERLKKDEIGGYIMGFDSVEFIVNTGVEMYFSDFSIFEYLNLLKEIEYKEVVDRFREHLLEENSILSIVKPNEEEE